MSNMSTTRWNSEAYRYEHGHYEFDGNHVKWVKNDDDPRVLDYVQSSYILPKSNIEDLESRVRDLENEVATLQKEVKRLSDIMRSVILREIENGQNS